jgi:hypothetical protein
MARRGPAAILAAALERGAITERRFGELTAAVAAGQDIGWVEGLTGRKGAAPDPAAIGINASSSRAPGELSDDQADQLWPPRTEADAQRRFRAAEAAAAARLSEVPESELYDRIFGSGPGHEEHNVGQHIHEPTTGPHSHRHSAYGEGGDQAHVHVHTHANDANHDHH